MYLADLDNLDRGFVGQGSFDIEELMKRATSTQQAAQAAKQEVTEALPQMGMTAVLMGLGFAGLIYWFLIR